MGFVLLSHPQFRLTVHHRADIMRRPHTLTFTSMGNLEQPVSPTCMSLDCDRNPVGTQESNPEPSFDEVTVLAKHHHLFSVL